jgi:hypothetical protein
LESWDSGKKKELENHEGILRDITAGWEQGEAAKLLQLPTPKLYALLQRGALLSGDKKQLDRNGWSILQRADEPKEGESRIIGPDGLVSGGGYDWYGWGDPRVDFYGCNPGYRYHYARLRPVVMKNS